MNWASGSQSVTEKKPRQELKQVVSHYTHSQKLGEHAQPWLIANLLAFSFLHFYIVQDPLPRDWELSQWA